jgi:PhzF family phenazine biosynthesis protein
MKFAYRLLNVFAIAGQNLSGNPLCVFEDGRGLSDAQMQALALQFNLSETTFIFPDEQSAARVRIFTPAIELPFAGHPTLGTAHVVRDLCKSGDKLALAMQAGLIPVAAQGDNWTLKANAPMTRPFDIVRRDELAAALGLSGSDFAADPLWVSTGMEQLLVPLATRNAVLRIAPGAALAGFPTASGKVSVYAFAPLDEGDMQVRFFFSKTRDSIGEDPATGSACANLGGYAIVTSYPLPLARTLHQGESLGRPSLLKLAVDAEQRIYVSGEVVELGRGYVEI